MDVLEEMKKLGVEGFQSLLLKGATGMPPVAPKSVATVAPAVVPAVVPAVAPVEAPVEAPAVDLLTPEPAQPQRHAWNEMGLRTRAKQKMSGGQMDEKR